MTEPIKQPFPLKPQPSESNGIVAPHVHDVLSGRGHGVNSHSGNEYFRFIVWKYKEEYVKCSSLEQKKQVSRGIVEEIKKRNPPGRFLKQDENSKLWYDIGEKAALQKASQALREDAPEIRENITEYKCDAIVSAHDHNDIRPEGTEQQTEQQTEQPQQQTQPRPQPTQPQSRRLGGIRFPHENDVLSGRGKFAHCHEGNEYFRWVIQKYKVAYVKSPPMKRKLLCRLIVEEIKKRNPPGRFLKQDETTDLWYEIDEIQAVNKAAQAFREGASEIRKQLAENPENHQPQQPQAIPQANAHALNAGSMPASHGSFVSYNAFSVTQQHLQPLGGMTTPLAHTVGSGNFVTTKPLMPGINTLGPCYGNKMWNMSTVQNHTQISGASAMNGEQQPHQQPTPQPQQQPQRQRKQKQISKTKQKLKPKPKQQVGIATPHNHDVLCGRGRFVNNHAGNFYFRKMVGKHKIDYVKCPAEERKIFARIVVEEIKKRNPPGRFLKQNETTKLWHSIGETEALTKARQALREGAPEIEKQIQDDEIYEDAVEPGDDDVQPQPLPLPKGWTVTYHDHDVLPGTVGHPGNEYFCEMVRKHKSEYLKCPEENKRIFSRIILEEIQRRNPPGRFLKQDQYSRLWYEIGEEAALHKVCQALTLDDLELYNEMSEEKEDEDIVTPHDRQEPLTQAGIATPHDQDVLTGVHCHAGNEYFRAVYRNTGKNISRARFWKRYGSSESLSKKFKSEPHPVDFSGMMNSPNFGMKLVTQQHCTALREDAPGISKKVAEEGEFQTTDTPHDHDVQQPQQQGQSGIVTPHAHDVLFGRGNFVHFHAGNEYFRALVKKNKVKYTTFPLAKKKQLPITIFDSIKSRNPPGRFLRQDPTTKLWYEVGEKEAVEKTCQALRDCSPNVKARLREEERLDDTKPLVDKWKQSG